MGLFNFKKKKATVEEVKTASNDAYMQVMNNSLLREVTHNVVLAMNSYGIIDKTELKYFVNDGDMLQGLVMQHTTSPQITAFKNKDIKTYLFICGMHAFGSGVYITIEQAKLGKSVSEFSMDEKIKIMNDFNKTDSYELALRELGVPLSSKNKQILDQIIVVAAETAMREAGDNVVKQGNIWAYMQVLFNAGITMVLEQTKK